MSEIVSWEAGQDYNIQPFSDAHNAFSALLADEANYRYFWPEPSFTGEDRVVSDAVYLINPMRGLLITVRESVGDEGVALEYDVAKTDGSTFVLTSRLQPSTSVRFVYDGKGLREVEDVNIWGASVESQSLFRQALNGSSPMQLKKNEQTTQAVAQESLDLKAQHILTALWGRAKQLDTKMGTGNYISQEDPESPVLIASGDYAGIPTEVIVMPLRPEFAVSPTNPDHNYCCDIDFGDEVVGLYDYEGRYWMTVHTAISIENDLVMIANPEGNFVFPAQATQQRLNAMLATLQPEKRPVEE